MRYYPPNARGQVRTLQVSGARYHVLSSGTWLRTSPRATRKQAKKEEATLHDNADRIMRDLEKRRSITLPRKLRRAASKIAKLTKVRNVQTAEPTHAKVAANQTHGSFSGRGSR